MNILQWLKDQGYDYTWNIRIAGEKPDIVAFNEKEVIVIEIRKSASEIPKAVRQCLSYIKMVNKVYVALPIKETKNLDTALLRKQGIGLLQANNTIKVLIEPSFLSIKNKEIIENLKKKNLCLVPKRNNHNVKDEIVYILSKNLQGLSITEMSNLLKLHRHTVVKYVNQLVCSDAILLRKVGPVKLYYLNEKSGSK